MACGSSSFPPPPTETFLFPTGQRASVNNENSLAWVNDINHLQESAAHTTTDHEPFVVVNLSRKRLAGMSNDHFRLPRVHTVFGDMVAVPVDPAKFHLAIRRVAKSSYQNKIAPGDCKIAGGMIEPVRLKT
jgi:hypothetical protein